MTRRPARLPWPWVMRIAIVVLATTMLTRDAIGGVFPGASWPTRTPAEMGLDETSLCQAREYARTGGGSGLVVRGGSVVLTWGDLSKRYDLKSTTKSIGVTALGLAIGDGRLSLDDPAHRRHPGFGVAPEDSAPSGWREAVTLRHLATHTAGFEKPGGFTPLRFEPGTKWLYSDGGPNWLAECVTLAYGQDLNTLMFERVFTPLGITSEDLTWRTNAYRPAEIDGIPRREIGSGIHANVNAMARIGYLYLRGGRWKDQQILPRSFVDAARAPVPEVVGLPVDDPDEYGHASDHYGLLWWNNGDGTLEGVPRDAFWSWGLFDSLIVVIPSLDLVMARAGDSWERTEGADPYEVLRPFLEPIVASVVTALPDPEAPYPPSRVIRGIDWAPASTIVRQAVGSDNWPITWADDDALYTAYGDGWGFEPQVPEKLSLGLAKVVGSPDDFRGINIRSPTGEHLGDGASGKKASGMLMIEGRLYMLVRNADNAQLAWSDDQAQTWTWSPWRFTTSFGCPTFLNFGKDYQGARDEYVYVYSHDQDSAYEAADRMVLARVPRDQITDQDAYTVFAGLDAQGKPLWSDDIAQRDAVFEHPERCYRSGITYNAGLGRYILVHIHPGGDTRFEGGFSIHEAPEPWGPWSTVFFTERWDVGPGETASFPTKWMSPDGIVLHLVFSGEDSFSVRRATLLVGEEAP